MDEALKVLDELRADYEDYIKGLKFRLKTEKIINRDDVLKSIFFNRGKLAALEELRERLEGISDEES